MRKLKPHVVITDVKMPLLDGIQATKILKKEFPKIPVIALTMFNEEAITFEMLDAGASGFLTKNCEKIELIEAIKTVFDHKPFYGKDIANSLAQMLVKSRNAGEQDQPNALLFSKRELEVIRLICEQYTNKEIAEELNISIRTVEGYKDRILEKTGAKNTSGIVIYAIENKIYLLKGE